MATIQARIDDLTKRLTADVQRQQKEQAEYNRRFELDVLKYTKQVTDDPRGWTGRNAKDGKIYYEGSARYPAGYYTPAQHGRIRASRIYAHNQQFKPWTVPAKVKPEYAEAKNDKIMWMGSQYLPDVKPQYVTPAQWAKLAVTSHEVQKKGYDAPWYEQVKDSLTEEFSGQTMKRAGVFGFKSILMDTDFLRDAFRDTNKAMKEADEYSAKDFAIDSAILALSVVGGELAGPFVGRAIQDLKGSLDGVISTAIRDGSVVAEDGSLILLTDAEKARLQRVSAVEDEKWAEQMKDYENQPTEDADRSAPKEEEPRDEDMYEEEKEDYNEAVMTDDEIAQAVEEDTAPETAPETAPTVESPTEPKWFTQMQDELSELDERAEQMIEDHVNALEFMARGESNFTTTPEYVNGLSFFQKQTDDFVARETQLIKQNARQKLATQQASRKAGLATQGVTGDMDALLSNLGEDIERQILEFTNNQRARFQRLYEEGGKRVVASAIGTGLHGVKDKQDATESGRRKIRDIVPEVDDGTDTDTPTADPEATDTDTPIVPDATGTDTRDPYVNYDDVGTFNKKRQQPKILGYIFYPATQSQDYLNQYVKF